MASADFKMTSKDNVTLHIYSWGAQETDNPKGVVQVAHGMAEHGERYERFAQRLVSKGYLVYANDHRGHGKTAGSVENLGYFADENGWDLVVEDMHLLTQTIKSKHPDLPVFLLGHSMGSLLASIRGISAMLWLNTTVLAQGQLDLLDLNEDGTDDRSPDVEIVPVGIEKLTYLRMILTLAKETRLYEFPYDWRRHLEDSADRLHRTFVRTAGLPGSLSLSRTTTPEGIAPIE